MNETNAEETARFAVLLVSGAWLWVDREWGWPWSVAYERCERAADGLWLVQVAGKPMEPWRLAAREYWWERDRFGADRVRGSKEV